MTNWNTFEEISRVMALLCLTTALAAVTAAAVLLIREGLTERFRTALKTGIKKRTGILLLAAAGVWILVIGQSVSAAETANKGSTEEAAENPKKGSTEEAAENPQSSAEEAAAEGPQTGETGRNAPETEIAAEEEPEETSGNSETADDSADTASPEIAIEMAQEVNRDKNGTVYCRADNAGLRIRFTEEGEEDTGIVSYRIVLRDSRGKEIRREKNTGEDGADKEKCVEAEVDSEKTASLSEGQIRVTAEAEDAAGNRGSGEFSFILDKTAPVGEIHYRAESGGFLYGEDGSEDAAAKVYFASDIAVSLVVEERCGGQKAEADPEWFRLVRMDEEGIPESGNDELGNNEIINNEIIDYETGHFTIGGTVIRQDGRVRFGACGRDLAGNALIVREVFEPGVTAVRGRIPAGDAQIDQGDPAGCAPCSVIVRDTVCPVFTARLSLPLENPAGIDEEKEIVYYGKDPGQYPDGQPVIRGEFTVRDQNADTDRVELRYVYAAALEGEGCGEAAPGWKDSLPQECRVTRERDGEGSPGQILVTMQRVLGGEETPDGVYRFGIGGTDRAGNPLVPADPDAGDGRFGLVCEDAREGAYMTGKKVIDTGAPGGEVRIENKSGEVYCRLTAGAGTWKLERESYRPFRREDAAVIVYCAQDISPVRVSFQLASTAGDNNEAPPDGSRFSEGKAAPEKGAGPGGQKLVEGRILVRGGQVFRIQNLSMEDRAGNSSPVLAGTGDIYLDTDAPRTDIQAPAVKIRAVPEITGWSPDGRPLYAGPVSLEVFASDPGRKYGGSGLREVRCVVKVDGEAAREETLFEADGQGGESIPRTDGSGGELSPADGGGEASVYEYYGRILIPASGRWESNDIEVTVTAADLAGNRSDPEYGGLFRMGTDSTGPLVNVSFDNNDARSGRYFDKARTAVIAVRERNFDRAGVQVRAAGGVVGDWVRDSREPDRWTREVKFALDGAYTLAVTGADALGNPASVTYAGEAPRDFVIDRTPPLIEVMWDNTDVRNGKYYNRERRATIRITDLSFDERMVKTVPFSRPFRKVSETESERTAGSIPVYEAEIPFTQEGEWSLRLLCADLSGNAAAPLTEDPFVIDMTAPRLYFDPGTVRETGAYGGEVRPALRCEEENPAPGTLCARWNNLTGGGQLMECRKGAGSEAVLPDIPRERAAEGACLLSGTACDLAGNRTMIRRNLCLNRFGSLYDLTEDEKTLEMVRSYYTDARQPFVIAEYNASRITRRQITLYKNGSALVLKEGRDYSAAEEKCGEGRKYVYRIDSAVYSGEGKYGILLESEDEAGNYNSSPGRFMRAAQAPGRGEPSESGFSSPAEEYTASFAVDRTPPSVRLAGVEPDQRKFVADSLPVRIIPSDNMELSGLDIEIRDDGGTLLRAERIGKEELTGILSDNGGEVPFEIHALGKWQTLRAYAVDGAGNRSVKIQTPAGDNGYRVLVSDNLMVHLYRSGILPAIAFFALAAAIRYGYGVYKGTLA